MTLEKFLIFSVLVGLLSLWHQEGNDRIHILSFVVLVSGSAFHGVTLRQTGGAANETTGRGRQLAIIRQTRFRSRAQIPVDE